MLKTTTTYIASAAILLSAQMAAAGPLNGSYLDSIAANSGGNIVRVKTKTCKFYHPDGYTYKDRCPDELEKGSRKKRAAIGAGVGAALGAGIGAIAGGGKGAAIGAGAGAAAGAIGGAASLKRCWYFSGGQKVKVKCRQD